MVPMCRSHAGIPVLHRGVVVSSCDPCAVVEFRNRDPFEGMEALFADYRLVGEVEAIGAPAGEVMAFSPGNAADRSAMDAIPPHRWFRANEHLWMCHDGSVLLLAHGYPLVSRMLGA